MRCVTVLCVALALVATPAVSAVTPKPGGGDPRIQTIEYDPHQVVTLRVPLGYALTLEFAADERIENVVVGNSAVWQVIPNKAADHLFVKPMQSGLDTNMTVITSGRIYYFDMKPLPSADPNAAFAVRFIYPTSPSLPPAVAKVEASSYRLTGSRALKPMTMSDDGRSTSMIWPAKTAIPAVFVIDAQGREALVNGEMRDGRYVVDQIADQFIFRIGGEEARANRRILKERPR